MIGETLCTFVQFRTSLNNLNIKVIFEKIKKGKKNNNILIFQIPMVDIIIVDF